MRLAAEIDGVVEPRNARRESLVTAFAQFDPNLANRYQSYAGPGTALQSAPVRLQKQRTVVQPDAATSTGQSEFDIDRFDRASSPYAGGN